MKKAIVSVVTMIVTILLIVGIYFGVQLIIKYTPSKEVMQADAWFGVSGDEVAILYQNNLLDITGIYQEGSVYLPLTWVSAALNGRFYWDEGGQQLIYTLPDSIVYAGLDTIGSSGAPLLIKSEDEVYLLTGMVAAYTDIQAKAFTDGNVKRIFIDDRWEEAEIANIKKEGNIRVLGGIKSAILTTVTQEDKVTVLGKMEEWSYVKTGNGFLGYIENKCLGEISFEPQISTYTAPVYTNISLDQEICMVWHQLTVEDANGTLEELIAKTDGVNVIAPTWFMLTDNDGNYDSLASKSYVKKAHAMGIQVWATLDNFNRGDNVRSEILFADTDTRRNLIDRLITEVKELGIDGINLDVEGIIPEAGPHYVQFIRELSIDCRREGIILSVDTYVPTAYTGFYNRKEQGIVADYVIIMAYDEHYAGSDPGSVSSISYVENGIRDTLAEVPKEKLICALPFYMRLWQEEDGNVTSRALGINGGRNWIRDNNVELYWQEELAQYYGEKVINDVKYMIWLEEEESLSKKIQAVRSNGLAGAAYWRLGLDSRDIWETVKP